MISLHKVLIKIFGKILLAISLPDLVNEGKHVLKLWWGANQVHVQPNTQFKTGSKQGSARRPQKPSIPQPPISRAVFMFPVSCSAAERMQRGAPLEPGHTKISWVSESSPPIILAMSSYSSKNRTGADEGEGMKNLKGQPSIIWLVLH